MRKMCLLNHYTLKKQFTAIFSYTYHWLWEDFKINYNSLSVISGDNFALITLVLQIPLCDRKVLVLNA